MFGHYLTVALRNLACYRLHSAVSVIVLTLGLTCFLAAYLVVSYLTSYDRQFPNADRSVVIFQGMHGPKFGLGVAVVSVQLRSAWEQLALDVPELTAVARYRTIGASVSVDGEQKPRISIAPRRAEVPHDLSVRDRGRRSRRRARRTHRDHHRRRRAGHVRRHRRGLANPSP